MFVRSNYVITTLLIACFAMQPVDGKAQSITAEQLGTLEFRHIGVVGNRIASVSGVSGDPLVYYAGSAAGGLWKTEDGGNFWRPIFDDQDTHSIGALAVSTSDNQVVWAGTGEPHIRSNVTVGDGVYKSTDGGETWDHMGLEETGRISRIVIDPRDPSTVYVASLGHGHSPQEERGIYKTRNGGETWEHVLFVDENTGASSLIMDPNNPRILFAGMWQILINTWGRQSGGPGSAIYRSDDGGGTWERLSGHGLPSLPVGKIDICMSASNSQRIYGLIETGDGVPVNGTITESGELWRSNDGGSEWTLVNHSRDLGGRTAYYNNCRVTPDDADEVFFLTAGISRSLDGGLTYVNHSGRQRSGGDYHDLWFDPANGDRLIIGNDQGVHISVNRGQSYRAIELPVGQMYHVTADNAVPYNVLGNRQDGPSYRGPSNSLYDGGRIPRGDWHQVGGGESGFATPDPTNSDIVWSSASGAGAVGGIVVRHDEKTRQFRNVEVWPEGTVGWHAEDLKYRFQWTFPLLISSHDNNTVYVTSQYVHRTRNGGQSWDVISPDLTTNDKSRQGVSGGLTPDNLGVEYCCVIYSFDESRAQQGVFYAGSNDGMVHVSRDDGQTWDDVTGNFTEWPEDGVVRGIHASKWDPAKAYLVVEAHQVGNFEPYIYRTENYGETWTKITDGISDHILSFTRDIVEDPVRPGLLYVGTENRLYISFNDGDNWIEWTNNLPASPKYGLVVQEHFGDLVIGTYGRGFWIMDDLSPLQQLNEEILNSSAHLFRPRDAYRFNPRTAPATMTNDQSDGESPPNAAFINYWIGEETAGSDVTLRIWDSEGKMIRSLDGTSEAGMNRAQWDFRDEGGLAPTLRTNPKYADWYDLGADRERHSVQIGALRYPPGSYTVTMEVESQDYSQPLNVLKDPNSEGSLSDIRTQFALAQKIRVDQELAGETVSRIEWIRRQLYDAIDILEDQGESEDLVETAGALDAALVMIEDELIQLQVTGTGQDQVRFPGKALERLNYLMGGVTTADFRPTDQHVEVQAILRENVTRSRENLEVLLEKELSELNRALTDKGVSLLIGPGE